MTRAQDLADSDELEVAIRAGLVAYGAVHLLIAWLALQLALGHADQQASSTGALQQLKEGPAGTLLLWLIAAGFVLLVIWRGLQILQGDPEADDKKELAKRVGYGAKAVAYAVVAVSAVRIALGDSSQGGGTDSTTAKLMSAPGGQVLVAAVGLAIVAGGGYLIVKAYTGKFRQELDAEGQSGEAGQAYVWFGRIGYTAKGAAYAVVGGLFVWAAVTHDPQKSGGLDQALQKVREAPFGQILLVLIAVGIAGYGLFAFARARHLSSD